MAVFANPFNELLRLQHDLESLLNRPTSDVSFGSSAAGVFPPVNVFRDRQGDVVIRAELPGMKPEDIEVTTEARRLTIHGERKAEHEDTEHGGFYREVRYGRFERTVRLPGSIDPETVSATYRNGVLEISMKAPAGTQPTRVPVATE